MLEKNLIIYGNKKLRNLKQSILFLLFYYNFLNVILKTKIIIILIKLINYCCLYICIFIRKTEHSRKVIIEAEKVPYVTFEENWEKI